MARTDDIVTAFLAAHATTFLSHGDPIPWDRMRRMFPTNEAFADGFRFWRKGDEERSPTFDAWLEPGTAERLFVIDPARIVPQGPIAVGDQKVAPRTLHGFAGPSALALVVRRRRGPYELCRVAVELTPRTDLTYADVVSFVVATSESDRLKEQVLWWHDHNLHWTDETGWDAFARVAAKRSDTRLIDDMGTILSNVAFSDALRRAWQDYMQAHRNPNFGPRFAVHHVESLDALVLYADRSEARARLSSALDAIAGFAETEKLGGWGPYFRAARRTLEESDPAEWVARDFAGLEREALVLLSAAWQADAFGGMGSWNDVAPADAGRYAEVSQALYQSLRPAVEAAING